MSLFKRSPGPSPFAWIGKAYEEGKLPVRKPLSEIIEESPAEAAARRAKEFAQLTNPAPVVATRELIARGIALAEGTIQTFDPPVQPERRLPLTEKEQQDTAKAIVAAYDRARGNP